MLYDFLYKYTYKTTHLQNGWMREKNKTQLLLLNLVSSS